MRDYFEQYQNNFSVYDQDRKNKNEARALAIQDVVQKRTQKEIRNLDVLEYGCGTGWGIRQFAQQGNRCVGVDVMGEAIAIASKQHQNIPNLQFQRIAGRLPFPDRSFDFVFSSEVVEHVPVDNRPFFFQELRRVMRDEGVGFLSYPNFWFPWEQHYHVLFHHWAQKIWKRKNLLYEDIPSKMTIRDMLRTYFDCQDVTSDFLSSAYVVKNYPKTMVKLTRLLARTPFAVQDYLLLQSRAI